MLQPRLKNKVTTGWWRQGAVAPATGDQEIKDAIRQVTRCVFLVNCEGKIAAATGGNLTIGGDAAPAPDSARPQFPLRAYAPALHPEDLGDPYFKKAHRLRYAYIVGAMANGISSAAMVEAAATEGMLGFFGAAGLSLAQIDAAIAELKSALLNRPFGMNLIHSPADPGLEAATVELYLQRGITLVSASAYLDLTLPLVHYRVKGIHRASDGSVICPNRIIAKVSRVEVARKFFAPPPEKLLRQLVEQKAITDEQAHLAAAVPVAEALTAEADSGGHTDNRPAITLLPTMLALRDSMVQQYSYPMPICVGLAGGIATPDSTAAAFAMGAAYVLTGSINQPCVEAGTSDTVRYMLAEAQQADIAMAPSADMFELGVKVQVLKRGTMFPLRAAKLYDLYQRYDQWEAIPMRERQVLERDFFRCAFEDQWQQTQKYFAQRDPAQIERAAADAKHKLALVFRSYLGQSSQWANSGDPSRKIDYQIWCGPSLGAFNAWAEGSFFENPDRRHTATVAMNLMVGAAVKTRINWIRSQGVELPVAATRFDPLSWEEIQLLLNE